MPASPAPHAGPPITTTTHTHTHTFCPPLQINLYDAVRRTISLTGPGGKSYRLKEGKLAVMLVRPRG